MVKIILTILLLAVTNFPQSPCPSAAHLRTKGKTASAKPKNTSANASAVWMRTRRLNDLVITETDDQLFVSGSELGLFDPYRECYGLIWRYRNGTWEPQKLEFVCSVKDMQWQNSQKGWIRGDFSLYRTEDGGRSWHPVNDDDHRFVTSTFFFLNEKTAWYFGSDEFLKMMSGDSYANLAKFDVLREREIKFVSPMIGWLHVHTNKSKPELLHTLDGGKTWNVFDDLAKEVWDFQLDSVDLGYAIAVDSIVRTRDGGVSWEDLGLKNGKDLQRVFFLDAVHGWATGRNSCRTSDGGLTWSCWDLPEEMFLNTEQERLIFLNTMQGWLLTLNGLYVTENGGRSWRREYLTYKGECF
jgi:photosystem II stability/assembly factor-like uncharacterized protein